MHFSNSSAEGSSTGVIIEKSGVTDLFSELNEQGYGYRVES